MRFTCQVVQELVGKLAVALAQGTAGGCHSNPQTCLRLKRPAQALRSVSIKLLLYNDIVYFALQAVTRRLR